MASQNQTKHLSLHDKNKNKKMLRVDTKSFKMEIII